MDPSQQSYRDKALEYLTAADRCPTLEGTKMFVAQAQVYATLAISETLVDGYSGVSLAELVAKRG